MMHRLTKFGVPTLAVTVIFLPDPALAANAVALPWEAPLSTIQASLSGVVVQSMAIIAIVLAGLTYAFSEGGGVMRRSSGMVVGLSSATLAGGLAADLFGAVQGFAF